MSRVINGLLALVLVAGLVFSVVNKVSAASISITSPTSTSNVSAGPITVTGTAEPSKNVKLYANDVLVGTTKVTNDGSWSVDATLTSSSNTLRADLYDDPMGYLNVFSGPLSLLKFDTSNNTVTDNLPAGLTGPSGVVVHPSQPLAYVIDKPNGSVAVVNTNTNTITTTVDLGTYSATGTGPTAIAISPSGSKLYVATDTNKIVVVNTSDNLIATTVSVGSNPSEMAVSGDGSKLYVIDGSNVLVRNATSLANIDTVDMANSCYDIVLDTTDSKAFVACDNGSSGQVESINLSNDTLGSTVIYTSGAANNQDRLAITPNDSTLYVSSHSDNDIQYFTASTLAAGPSSPITGISTPTELAVTPDGSKLYVANDADDGHVTQINTGDNSIAGTIDLSTDNPGPPFSMAVSSDSSKLFVAGFESGYISVVNTSNRTLSSTIRKTYNGYSMVITKDGTKAYITARGGYGGSGNGTLTEINLVSNQIDWTTDVGLSPIGVTLNSDETKAYVADNAKDTGFPEVSVVNLTNHTLITSISGIGSQPFAIVYNSRTDRVYVGSAGSSSVSIINPNTDTKESSGITAGNVLGLTTSPDGAKLYATSATGKLYVINPVDKTVVTKTAGGVSYDVLSNSTGTKVYLATAGAAEIDIYDVNSGTFDTPISVGGVPFGLGITPDDGKLFVTSINSSTVKAIDLSDNSITSFTVNGSPSAFGNFVTQTLLATASVKVNGSLVDTGQKLMILPPLFIGSAAAYMLYADRRRDKKTAHQ